MCKFIEGVFETIIFIFNIFLLVSLRRCLSLVYSCDGIRMLAGGGTGLALAQSAVRGDRTLELVALQLRFELLSARFEKRKKKNRKSCCRAFLASTQVTGRENRWTAVPLPRCFKCSGVFLRDTDSAPPLFFRSSVYSTWMHDQASQRVHWVSLSLSLPPSFFLFWSCFVNLVDLRRRLHKTDVNRIRKYPVQSQVFPVVVVRKLPFTQSEWSKMWMHFSFSLEKLTRHCFKNHRISWPSMLILPEVPESFSMASCFSF